MNLMWMQTASRHKQASYQGVIQYADAVDAADALMDDSTTVYCQIPADCVFKRKLLPLSKHGPIAYICLFTVLWF